MKTALVLVDIQKDFFPGGKKELFGSEEATSNASKLLSAARKNNMKVIHVKQLSKDPGFSFCLPDSAGAEIHPSVAPLEGEEILVKNSSNSFKGTDFDEILYSNDISKLIFCGMMSHLSIDSTIRAAKDYGYECVLAYDACAACDLKFGEKSIPASAVNASFAASLHEAFAEISETEKLLTLI